MKNKKKKKFVKKQKENNIKEVTIVDTKYSADTNLVQWLIQFEDGNQRVLAIPGNQLGYYVGVNYELTPELIIEACKLFKGKKKRLQFIADIKENEKKLSDDKIIELDKTMDEYPLRNIIQEMKKEEEQQ